MRVNRNIHNEYPTNKAHLIELVTTIILIPLLMEQVQVCCWKNEHKSYVEISILKISSIFFLYGIRPNSGELYSRR